MSRSVSLTLREAMYSQETDEIPVVLLAISHPSFAETLRISSDPTTRLSDAPLRYGTVSRGHTYLFAPFSMALPDDVDERAPAARLMMENVDRQLVEIIRSVQSPATATIELVLASSPDVLEIQYPAFDVRAAQYNDNIMTIEMSIDALTEEPFPAGNFDPSAFGGLF